MTAPTSPAPFEPNIALARAVVNVVTTYPELHDQKDITCGTAACLAGWTCALTLGYSPGDVLEGFRYHAVEETLTDAQRIRLLSFDVEHANREADGYDAFEWALEAVLLGVDPRDLHEIFLDMNNASAVAAFKNLFGLDGDNA